MHIGFESSQLHCLAGGQSAIDIKRLNLTTLEEAEAFLVNYGFDYQIDEQRERLWYYYRRAFVLLTESLGYAESDFPAVLKDRKDLKDLRLLLLFASDTSDEKLQKWSCALLRAIHVFVHSENDLFFTFPEEIQRQILGAIEKNILIDGSLHKTFLKMDGSGFEPVELKSFEMKSFKGSTSTVIKLLAKPDALAMKIYDKLGVRFVTKNLFDTFRVIRFLTGTNMISFPHIMPDQSSNNLFPVDLFSELVVQIQADHPNATSDEVSQILLSQLESSDKKSDLFKKSNQFSGYDYQFIKFITRKLIRVQSADGKQFSFFFPYEVQI
ncbi:MAG: TIGR04552 family protein, partial [Pseudobdellovibrionaceae bacterium]